MTEWFQSLDSREQNFVSVGAVVTVIALLYFVIWSPINNRHNAMQADVDLWQASLTELKGLQSRMASGGQRGTPTSRGSQRTPIAIIDQALETRGLHPYRKRIQPTTSNGIRVEFENIAFDELIVWLGDLSEQHALHVQAGSFSSGNRVATGRVNATLTLERAL